MTRHGDSLLAERLSADVDKLRSLAASPPPTEAQSRMPHLQLVTPALASALPATSPAPFSSAPSPAAPPPSPPAAPCV